LYVDLKKPHVNKNSYAQMRNFLLYLDNQKVCYKKLSTLNLKSMLNSVALFIAFMLVRAKFYVYFNIRIKDLICFLFYIFTFLIIPRQFYLFYTTFY